jgi:hypothetical protein
VNEVLQCGVHVGSLDQLTAACTASRVLCLHGVYSLKAEGADRVGLSVRMFQHENISPHSDQTWYARYATAANPII